MLEVKSVEKSYKTVKAIDRLSFRVDEGEIFALLGPNGAGKTSMARILAGISRPDGGEVRWRTPGGDGGPPPAGQFGYLPEERGLYKEVAVLKTLTYFGILRGMRRRRAAREAADWLERLGLADRAAEKVDALSKGNQQKVQFIASILHRPRFAVLDEPFVGLDPVSQDAFLELLRGLRDGGMTVLLSSHQMQLVERLADRILLMNRGRAVLRGTLEEIRAGARAGTKLTLRVRGRPGLAAFESHPAVAGIEAGKEGEVALLIRKGQSLSDLMVRLGSELDILAVRSERLSLHDIFVQAVEADTQKGNKEQGGAE